MKRTAFIMSGFIIGAGVVAGGVSVVAGNYLSQPEAKIEDCSQSYTKHEVTIQDKKARPYKVNAKQCDQLTITNLDKTERDMSFGVHDKHVAYDGIESRLLRPGESFTINLNRSGEYTYHDHFDEKVGGVFVVSAR